MLHGFDAVARHTDGGWSSVPAHLYDVHFVCSVSLCISKGLFEVHVALRPTASKVLCCWVLYVPWVCKVAEGLVSCQPCMLTQRFIGD
jgi:hypothetical protein